VKIILIGVLTFTAVAVMEAVAYTLRYFADRRKDELKRRLSALGTSENVGTGRAGLLRRDKLASNATLDAILRSLKFSARLESMLEQTELEMTVAQLMGMIGGAGFLGLLLGLLANSGVLMLVPTVVFALIPLAFVSWKRAQRNQRLSEQLPDALDMMARSLRAGHALSTSFKMVATEMPTPVNIEFGRAFEAQELGQPFERSVADMTRRAPDNQDLKIFALSVIVQKETGGNLVEIIEKIADTIRSRYKFQGKLRGLTAEGRVSALVVGALPILSMLFMLVSNRPYIWPLFSTDTGNHILAAAAAIWAMGFAITRRMTKVKI